MSKVIAYSVVERKNLLKPAQAPKFYAQAQAKGTIDLDEMSIRIEEKCSLHSADVLAVFRAIEKEIVDSLERGEIVKLGGLGTLQIGLSSAGATSRSDFHSHLIQRTRINFRPGKRFFGMLSAVEYQKVSRRGRVDVLEPVLPVEPQPAPVEPVPVEPEAVEPVG